MNDTEAQRLGIATRYHGMSRWSWEVVKRQGSLRPAYSAQDGERIYKVVCGRGFVYFTSTARMAGVYAGGDPRKRLPTLLGRGRWKLPGGIANQNGVVIAADFLPGELAWTHRPGSHEEYVTDRAVDASRLRVVAYVPKGSNVAEAVSRGVQPPPLSAAERDRLEAIDKDVEIRWQGPLIADLEASGRLLRYVQPATPADGLNAEQVAAEGGDWRAALDRATAA